jgi:hypothetical protein
MAPIVEKFLTIEAGSFSRLLTGMIKALPYYLELNSSIQCPALGGIIIRYGH